MSLTVYRDYTGMSVETCGGRNSWKHYIWLTKDKDEMTIKILLGEENVLITNGAKGGGG